MNNDRITEVYYGLHSNAETTLVARERIHWICSQTSGTSVLDLGCSQGIVTVLLARQGFRVFGIDREEPALGFAAKERAKEPQAVRERITLIQAQGASLPFASESFDTVVFTEVIEHLQDPLPVLAEIHRVLRQRGRLVLTTPFGFLHHQDHRQSYYLHGLLAVLRPWFSPTLLEVQASHFTRCVATRGPTTEPPPKVDAIALLEKNLLIKEKRYFEEITSLRDRLAAANLRYREASGVLSALRNQEQAQRDRTAGGRAGTPAAEVIRPVTSPQPSTADSIDARWQIRLLTVEHEQAQQKLKEQIASLQAEKRLELAALERDLAAMTSEKEVYYAKYVNAVHSFKAQKRRIQHLEREVGTLRNRLSLIETSRAWRLVRLYWRFRKEFVAGDRDSRFRFIQDVVSAGRGLLGKTARETRFEKKVEEYLTGAARQQAPVVVLMFSGTTYIQPYRGNRPIRITNSLLRRKVPVFFSYWRWKSSEAIPKNRGPLLFQSPIDLTLENMVRIAHTDFPRKKKIFVITFPHISCARYVNIFNAAGWVTVYDVRDDWEEFHKVGAAKWFNKSLERYIVNNVDVVTAVSRPLQKKIQAYMQTGVVHLSPNALDTRFPTGRRIQVRPVDGQQVIGYVGHLTPAWFDWDSLTWLARKRPDWKIEIIGHSMPARLELPPNVAYLGPRDYRGIVKAAKGWRAALIPFRISTLSDGVDPIKVYEYLSLGLPVVSFRMPQIDDYPYVYTARSREEFLLLTEKALTIDMDPRVIREFLASNRWEDRADQLLAWKKAEGPTSHLALIGNSA